MPAAPVPALALPALTTSARTAAARLEMAPADDHRRGAEAVLREHAGGDRARIERGEQQIVALPVLDLRGGGAEPHAGDRQQVASGAGGV